MNAPHRAAPVAYRPDIDGLRAIAIVPVLFFHAGIAPFAGGFVGVDVFFVISGYLITNFIGERMEAGAFSIGDFYLRRARRLFPALYTMLAFTAVIGWLWLSPLDLKSLGESIFAAVLFSANILFWSRTGYFDAPISGRPLLHTWSLGVEEQFYAAYPLFLLFVHRFFPHRRVPIIMVACALSFALNVILVPHSPSAAFYLAPSRIWELLLGALLAMGVLPPPTRKWSHAAGFLGVVLIAVAIAEFSRSTLYPGFAALLPTVGAASIIWAGTEPGGAATRLLSLAGPTFVGRISYALYLWHFPLLTFGAYLVRADFELGARIALLVLSVLLAIGSYLYIEMPVRQGKWPFGNRKVVIAASAAAIVVFGGLGLAFDLGAGFPARISAAGQRALAGATDYDPDRTACLHEAVDGRSQQGFCKFGVAARQPEYALWGDSHAESIRPAVDRAAKAAGRAGQFLGRSACPPILGVVRRDISSCASFNDSVLHELAARPLIHTVILAGRWGLWAEGTRFKTESGDAVVLVDRSAKRLDNHAALAAGLERTIAALIHAGKQVWLVGPVPEVGYNVPRELYLDALGAPGHRDIRPTVDEFRTRERFVFALSADLARKYPLHLLWPNQRLCNARNCEVQRDGVSLYADDQHLNRYGAGLIAGEFEPIFSPRAK